MIERITKKEDGVTYTSMNFLGGDICVTPFPICIEDILTTYGILFQQEDREYEIGIVSSQKITKETDIAENSVLMKFKSYKSVDVIIKQMQILRDWLYDNESTIKEWEITVSLGDDLEQYFPEFEENLKSNDSAVISSACLKMLSLLNKSQEDFGVKIANAVFDQALNVYEKSNLDMLRVFFNNARALYYIFPNNETIASILLQLDRGMLDLKFEKKENDDLDIHQDDIDSISKKFPDNAKIGLECMICYANLQANCSAAKRNNYPFAPTLSFVEQNIDNMEAISARFPDDRQINLIYSRSLAVTVSELFNHRNREMYNKFVELLKNLVKTRTFDVPKDITDFLQMIDSR